MIQVRKLWRLTSGVVLAGACLAGSGPAAEKIPAAPPAAAAVNNPGPPDSTADISSPSRQYAVAYDSLMQASWLKKQGMAPEAFALYTESQALFQKLAAEHPLWETNVVAFRIKYCADELAALRAATMPPADAIIKPTPRVTPGMSVALPVVPRPPGETRALPALPERDRDAQARARLPDEPADYSRMTERLRTALQQERANKLKAALEGYLTVLAEQPQNREAINGAGRCYLRAGLINDAQGTLERGMLLPNPDAELNLLMALVYCVNSEFYKAYQLLLIVLDEQPSNAIAHLAMGVTQAGLEKLDNARVETQKAIQLDPKLGDAYYNLARLSLKLKPSSPGVAREHYRNALRFGATPDPALAKQLP